MPNSSLAAVIIEQSLAWGVRDFVVCAGARNAPLVLPLLNSPEEIRIWNHFDERAAAFFALGLAKRKGRPVAIVTTSGTAVAELLPATIEAHYSAVPLVLITADRPKRFRGTGAPQSIFQPGIFGEHVEGSFDCEAPEEFPADFPWNRSRPIHLNPCFEEPVKEPAATIDWVPALEAGSGPFRSIQPSSFADPTLLSRFIEDFDEGVVLLGELDAADQAPVRNFVKKLGAPFWAEATSGLMDETTLARQKLAGGDAAFRSWTPRKVLRIGGVPSLRFWRDLENQTDIPVLNVTQTGFPGLSRPGETTGMINFAEVEFEQREQVRPEGKRTEVFDLLWRFPKSELSLIGRLWQFTHRDCPVSVFLGNSLPIREWSLYGSLAAYDIPNEYFANRGANGIDGEVSTFLGTSEGAEESWGIFGDLTALYDLNAPWVVDQLSPCKRRIVVVNNGGGRIFSRLPSMRDVPEAGKTVTENRHGMSFEQWARMWNFDYERWEKIEDHTPKGDRTLIELIPDPEETEAFWEAYEQLAPDS